MNVNKLDIVEKILKSVDFKSKEELVVIANKMKEIALKNEEYSEEVKNAFVDCYNELSDPELSYDELLEIKQLITA